MSGRNTNLPARQTMAEYLKSMPIRRSRPINMTHDGRLTDSGRPAEAEPTIEAKQESTEQKVETHDATVDTLTEKLNKLQAKSDDTTQKSSRQEEPDDAENEKPHRATSRQRMHSSNRSLDDYEDLRQAKHDRSHRSRRSEEQESDQESDSDSEEDNYRAPRRQTMTERSSTRNIPRAAPQQMRRHRDTDDEYEESSGRGRTRDDDHYLDRRDRQRYDEPQRRQRSRTHRDDRDHDDYLQSPRRRDRDDESQSSARRSYRDDDAPPARARETKGGLLTKQTINKIAKNAGFSLTADANDSIQDIALDFLTNILSSVQGQNIKSADLEPLVEQFVGGPVDDLEKTEINLNSFVKTCQDLTQSYGISLRREALLYLCTSLEFYLMNVMSYAYKFARNSKRVRINSGDLDLVVPK